MPDTIEKEISDHSDHDILVIVYTQLKGLKDEFVSLRDEAVKRVDILEQEKANAKDLELLQNKINDDIEVRVRKLENNVIKIIAWASGAGAVVSFIISYLK